MITFLTEKIKLHKQKSETTIILLPTLLPNLSTYGLQMVTKLYRIPQETLVGVYNNQKKNEREVRVWTPFEPVEGWGNTGPIRAANLLHLCINYHKPASYSWLEITENTKEFLRKN